MMAGKRIDQLGVRDPLITDVLPISGPTTGPATKATIQKVFDLVKDLANKTPVLADVFPVESSSATPTGKATIQQVFDLVKDLATKTPVQTDVLPIEDATATPTKKTSLRSIFDIFSAKTESDSFPNNSTGTPGEIRVSPGYLFVCTAANSWKRVSLSSF
jgi:hypothetical protein